eukprot:scpid74147/ scgid10124/ 
MAIHLEILCHCLFCHQLGLLCQCPWGCSWDSAVASPDPSPSGPAAVKHERGRPRKTPTLTPQETTRTDLHFSSTTPIPNQQQTQLANHRHYKTNNHQNKSEREEEINLSVKEK